MPMNNEIKDLKALQERLISQKKTAVRTIVIPAGTCGQASGVNDLIRVAKREILANRLTDKVRLRITGCHGFCQMEPSVLIEPNRTFYPKIGPREMALIVAATAKGEVLENLLFIDEKTGNKIEKQDSIPFFNRQKRTILARNEKIDPMHIHTCLESGGYSALIKVLEGMEPQSVVEEVKRSGLRGRGGAGFPTGSKWEMFAARSKDGGKFLVCNADEGDPGAYMDRSVLEGNPHSIIEGMIIGAYATGAAEGIVYVRNEYPLAIKHLRLALHQAREMGLLGDNILRKNFSFAIKLVKGAGAFVCGEETALIRSIEGLMGEPKQRPPFPVQRGIDGKPTMINNVETWANIPVILEHGASAFGRTGIKNNSGSKIFSLVGKVKYTGLVEVPMGTPIQEIIYDLGGGPADQAPIKAVQTGGPSGGCIPSHLFHLPIDYESLVKAGSIMGSGGMIVMDEHTCMVDVAKYFMNFLKEESCGKCFTCRKGTQRMYEILNDISEGKANSEQLELLTALSQTVKDTSMCGLGQTAANPVLSTLQYFRDEYLAHIEKKQCPAGVCKALITYAINKNCTGCMLCLKACPEAAISGRRKEIHVVDKKKCIKCGVCKSICKSNAVEVGSSAV
jgi:NADH-quinone oxidoreductase subunit F